MVFWLALLRALCGFSFFWAILSSDMCWYKLWYQLVLSWEGNEDNLKQSKGVYRNCKIACQENWWNFFLSHCGSLPCKDEKKIYKIEKKICMSNVLRCTCQSSCQSSLSSILGNKVSIKEQKLQSEWTVKQLVFMVGCNHQSMP